LPSRRGEAIGPEPVSASLARLRERQSRTQPFYSRREDKPDDAALPSTASPEAAGVKAKREESSSSQPAAHPARSHPSIRATPPTPEPARRETASVSDSSKAADSTDAMSRLLAAKKRNRR